MKNFSKTLISMAAVMAVGSAMAVGAMAETLNFDQTNLTKDGTITITSGVTTGKSQYTLLVVKGTLDEETQVYSYDANSDTIKQVDQNDLGTPFSTIVLGTKQADNTYKLDEGSYKVLVGNNDGTIDSGTFTVSSTPEVKYDVQIVIGDINGDKKILANDVNALKKYKGNVFDTSNARVGKKYLKDDGVTTIVIGDITGEGKILANDVNALKKYKGNVFDTSNSNITGDTLYCIEMVE